MLYITIMDISNKLKILRGNMTQAELSRRSGVDKAIISKIEAGKMSGTVECHEKLANVFGLNFLNYMRLRKRKNPSLPNSIPAIKKPTFIKIS